MNQPDMKFSLIPSFFSKAVPEYPDPNAPAILFHLIFLKSSSSIA